MPSHRYWKFWAALSAVLCASTALATEPDFFISFSTCKFVIAPLTMTKEPLQVGDADPVVNACTKKGERITCQLSFESGGKGIKGNIGEYIVEIDVPPILAFKHITGQEYIIANTTNHAAVMSGLVLDLEQIAYAGSKVCHGLYMTNFEYKNFKKKGNP